MNNDQRKKQLRSDLRSLALRYIEHHDGCQMDGLAALGEDIFQFADCLYLADPTNGGPGWAGLLKRLQQLSG